MFQSLVDPLTERLRLHHQNYSSLCKAELWEEVCARSLKDAGFGSDWKPDYNHGVGVDQVTDCGIRISNKGGSFGGNKSWIEISGSRLTSHETLDDKLKFLSNKTEDYIFCLASDKKDKRLYTNPIYYLAIIESDKLQYQNAVWKSTFNGDKITKYECVGEGYTADIRRSMSDQLWTKISCSLFSEIYEIKI